MSKEDIQSQMDALRKQLADLEIVASNQTLIDAAIEAGMKDRIPISKENLLLIELGNMIHATWASTKIGGGINSRQKQIADLLCQGEAIELLRAITTEKQNKGK